MTIKVSTSNLCDAFVKNDNLRVIILGAAQFCVDLCDRLNLPVNVSTSSLLCLQLFFECCHILSVEIPLVCSACVLLSWKYWEDFIDIFSTQKLNCICEELFNILMNYSHYRRLFPLSTLHNYDEYNQLESLRLNNINVSPNHIKSVNTTVNNSERNTSKAKDSFNVTHSSDHETKPDDKKPVDNFQYFFMEPSNKPQNNDDSNLLNPDQSIFVKEPWRLPESINQTKSEKLTMMDWIVRDEGGELTRIRTKIKVYEACLLRCLNFELNSLNFPFQRIHLIAHSLWMEQIYKCSCNNQFSVNAFPSVSSKCHFTSLKMLSNFLAMDFHRSPFCLLWPPHTICLVAVWKAAVILGFPPSLDFIQFKNSSNNSENTSQTISSTPQKSFYLKIPSLHFKIILHQYRLLYAWLADFQQNCIL